MIGMRICFPSCWSQLILGSIFVYWFHAGAIELFFLFFCISRSNFDELSYNVHVYCVRCTCGNAMQTFAVFMRIIWTMSSSLSLLPPLSSQCSGRWKGFCKRQWLQYPYIVSVQLRPRTGIQIVLNPIFVQQICCCSAWILTPILCYILAPIPLGLRFQFFLQRIQQSFPTYLLT